MKQAQEYDIVIVGAGASGLMAAVSAAREAEREAKSETGDQDKRTETPRILILERMDRPGRKLLATGNGRCNFTNLDMRPACFYSDSPRLVRKVLHAFDEKDTLRFFEELGILSKSKDGYMYPLSGQASSVLDVLLMEVNRLGIGIETDCEITQIQVAGAGRADRRGSGASAAPENPRRRPLTANGLSGKLLEGNLGFPKNGSGTYTGSAKDAGQEPPWFRCRLRDQKGRCWYARTVILACGGCAYPKLGSNGSGYRLVKAAGLRLIEPVPALTGLYTRQQFFAKAAGVRVSAGVSLYSEDQEDTPLAADQGEIQITDYGVSGIPVFNISRHAAKALQAGKGVRISLNFLPDKSSAELVHLLMARRDLHPEKRTEDFLIGIFQKKLCRLFTELSGIAGGSLCGDLRDAHLLRLAHVIEDLRADVTGTGDFDHAQVCAGGVDGRDLDDHLRVRGTLGCYITGELVDVDGICGGYNLQWAWASGYTAGKDAWRTLYD